MQQFRGTGVALVTPFKENGDIDFDSLKKVIDHCMDGKVDYLVSLGTTGETATMTKAERLSVLEFTVDAVAKRVPLVAGFGGNFTQELINSIKDFHFRGYDAILSASPYYNKPTQEGIYQHYKAIAAIAPLPVILYNVPGRTASNITAETTLRLANDFSNIIGIKEASGDQVQVMKILRDRPKNFLVISGDDIITLPLLGFGVDGVISVMANSHPRDFAQMVRYALKGDFEKARPLHFKLLELMQLIFVEGNPAGVKAALQIQGIISNSQVRLPLVKASEALTALLKAQPGN
jgi:4-hydroxy-tetrahydrodipicolinate synthase